MSSVTSIRTPVRTKFRNAVRLQEAITAPAERKVLLWLAKRVPESISPDHLTALGFAAQFLAGVAYGLARWNKYALWLGTFFLSMNLVGGNRGARLSAFCPPL